VIKTVKPVEGSPYSVTYLFIFIYSTDKLTRRSTERATRYTGHLRFHLYSSWSRASSLAVSWLSKFGKDPVDQLQRWKVLWYAAMERSHRVNHHLTTYSMGAGDSKFYYVFRVRNVVVAGDLDRCLTETGWETWSAGWRPLLHRNNKFAEPVTSPASHPARPAM